HERLRVRRPELRGGLRPGGMRAAVRCDWWGAAYGRVADLMDRHADGGAHLVSAALGAGWVSREPGRAGPWSGGSNCGRPAPAGGCGGKRRSDAPAPPMAGWGVLRTRAGRTPDRGRTRPVRTGTGRCFEVLRH